MSQTIWKFPLLRTDEQGVAMPKGAQPIAVAMQHGALCLWAVVDPTSTEVVYNVSVRGTGHPLGEVGSYVGTAQDGPLVWHVFVER